MLATSLAFTGCATTQPSQQIVARSYPAEGLPAPDGPVAVFTTVPHIVVDMTSIDVAGLEITAEERTRLGKAGQSQSEPYKGVLSDGLPGQPGEFVFHCLVRGLVVFCPFLAVATFAAMGTVHAGGAAWHAAKNAANNASAAASTYIPPEGDGVRLATRFSAHTRSENLHHAIWKRMGPAADGPREFPRLVIRVESIQLLPVHGGVVFLVTARSQGFTDLEVKGVEVVHEVSSPNRKVHEWLAAEGELFRDDLDLVFDALSQSIVAVHMAQPLRSTDDVDLQDVGNLRGLEAGDEPDLAEPVSPEPKTEHALPPSVPPVVDSGQSKKASRLPVPPGTFERGRETTRNFQFRSEGVGEARIPQRGMGDPGAAGTPPVGTR